MITDEQFIDELYGAVARFMPDDYSITVDFDSLDAGENLIFTFPQEVHLVDMKVWVKDKCGTYSTPQDLFLRSNGIDVWITTKTPLEHVKVQLIYNKSA